MICRTFVYIQNHLINYNSTIIIKYVYIKYIWKKCNLKKSESFQLFDCHLFF